MVRAGIFIGVDRTGTLRELKDAAAGAKRMQQWAIGKGLIAEDQAILISDADGGKVTPDQIFDAIASIVDGAGADQLLLYFAGHGVNINRSEHWLLSDAPRNPNAAVNVSGSVELARYCGIGHVAIFSDACRVAPEGIQAQNVRGQDVFPNNGGGDRAKPVDQFFACLLGKTAAEIKDPQAAADNFTALYTQELIAALSGDRPNLLDASTTPGESARFVRPRALEAHLEQAIPQLVLARGLAAKVNQNPDAIITSDGLWLARLEQAVPPPRMGGGGRPRDDQPTSAGAEPVDGDANVNDPTTPDDVPPTAPAAPAAPPVSLRGFSRSLYRSAIAGDHGDLGRQLQTASSAPQTGAGQLARSVETIAAPFGPDHFESQCGIKLRGARIAEVVAPRASIDRFSDSNDILRISGIDGPAASVLLRFEGGYGTVVPVLPGFIAALTVDDGELVDVTYEPSTNSARWSDYSQRLQELRALRAVAASASQFGRFRIDGNDAEKTAQQMQYMKSLDPTLAIYAAYAYHNLQAVDRIGHMSQWLQGDLGATFFDLVLLSRQLIDRAVAPDDRIVPFTPLLSQGWALLRANRVKLHPRLEGIERTVRESLWSLYDDKGLDLLASAMQTREVR
ncbi:caspase family protein [Montanilutibacter psychrotolerans]|uniref:Caspase family protein n=1 Tax=Montanilutibacter psychrotolerans TaxID=1327343 RepID=A0A3M8SVF8_9GAMM|nr:caspase family protein [Lysobacter psychrotolerans]RNF82840.1 hypothetical protein EER27_13095 [Lysobacter psychrotolerans]